ncbi:MAG: hypothetical protein ACT4RN_02085 [Pseudonocardia sp.]
MVGSTELSCRTHRSTHELDVVVVGESRQVCAIGEAKWRADPIGTGQLERLRHVRSLLEVQPAPVRLLLFSRSGSTDALRREAAAAGVVELIDLDRLYLGQ